MKNMKKILAVGALLAMGTMAMGDLTNNADIALKLTVTDPVTLSVASSELNFGTPTLAGVEGLERSTDFTVTGAAGLSVGITMTEKNELKNGNNQVIPFDMFIGSDQAEYDNAVSRTIGSDRTVTDTFKVVLGAAPNNKEALGEYNGMVTMTANYN